MISCLPCEPDFPSELDVLTDLSSAVVINSQIGIQLNCISCWKTNGGLEASLTLEAARKPKQTLSNIIFLQVTMAATFAADGWTFSVLARGDGCLQSCFTSYTNWWTWWNDISSMAFQWSGAAVASSLSQALMMFYLTSHTSLNTVCHPA